MMLNQISTRCAVLAGIVLLLSAAPRAGAGASPVADAAMRGDAAAVRALLQQHADVNAPQGDGMTALHWAAAEGDAAPAAALVGPGASPPAGTRVGHPTPPHIAAQASRAPVVR